MTYQEANSISIKDYLESLGILPVVDKLYYGMYHSPLRQDDTPSFKVDYGVNLWCDFGTGEGGSLIDLVMKQPTGTGLLLRQYFFFSREKYPRKESGKGGKEATSQPGRNP